MRSHISEPSCMAYELLNNDLFFRYDLTIVLFIFNELDV